ncbi:MAG: leucine-rich repeat domain-containing protein [Lachnospiraceae bacterium]|nr:leucine-rich repeat domain-containing protein [Lachnospiraceae bacterium]
MEKRWLIPLFFTFLAVVAIGCSNGTAKSKKEAWNYEEAVEMKSGAFTFHAYVSGDESKCWIYLIDVDKEKGDTSDLELPSEIEGKKVTRIGYAELSEPSEFRKNIFGIRVERVHNIDGYDKKLEGITKVTIPDSVTEIQATCFSGLRYLSSIKIPDGVHKLKSETFYGCERLKSVTLPKNLDSFHADALEDCSALKTLKISSENEKYEVIDGMLMIKNKHELIFVVAEKKTVKIPEGVITIGNRAFINSGAQNVLISSTVKNIGSQALENENIKNIKIAKDNKNFAISGQCIYAKGDDRLVVAMPNKKGFLRISNRIRKLDDTYSIAGGDVRIVVLSRNLEEVRGTGLSFSYNEMLKKVYFTGGIPPKVSDVKDGSCPLPISANIYVPKNAEDSYKEWYKDNDCYDHVESWNTYNQIELKKLEEKMNK